MRFFSINKNQNLTSISEKPFSLEKEIQMLTELNIDEIFGWEFIQSEYALNNFRIDSLCFDKEANAFVIIEYKNNKNFSVVDQGYSYLSLLLNNKADFVLLYNEIKQARLKKDSVDWSQSKVVFISPNFTTYQKEAINFRDLPIELWQIKQFENNTLMYLPIKAVKTTESIKSISSNNSVISEVSKEIKTYTEERLLMNMPENIVELYQSIKTEVLNLGDVSLEPMKNYIKLSTKKVIAIFYFQKNNIKIYFNMKCAEFDDHKQKLRDVSNIGNAGNGNSEFTYENIEDMEYLLSLIKQSYNKYQNL